MKKIIYIILVLILATLCFASCQQTSDFDKLNEMAYADHSQVSIGITVTKSGETQSLVHNIVVLYLNETTKHVAYTLQEYALFDIEGDTITIPSQQIITKNGAVTLENGKATDVTGDQVDYDFSSVGLPGMNFNDVCLENFKTENGTFSADISNMTLFLGKNIPNATNAKVYVNMQTLQSITLSFTVDGSDVTIVYTLG